jgi:RNA polymerase sigma-70 factor, ECF subfamily
MKPRGTLRLLPPPSRAGSLPERPDDELMQLAAAGVMEAFSVLVRRHEARVRNLCGRICGNAAEGDEAAQECFVKLWKLRAEYEPRARFEAYFYLLVRNHCRNRVREARRRTGLPSDRAAAPQPSSELSDGCHDPLQRLVDQQRRERLQRSLSKLSAAQRDAIVLRFSAELEYATIAELTGCSEATLRTRVFLGLNRLRKLLSKGTPR